VIAALGGMAGPALVYLACNWDDEEALRGWAFPIATDIAFALVVFIWVCVLKSGIRATLAGVITGLAIPLRATRGSSPAHDLEQDLHPWVAFGVLPVFAFTNAGVGLAGVAPGHVLHPIQLGIGLGLFVGKQLGVIGAIWVSTRIRLATLPEGADWRQLYGVALLIGIGFTMSLFIGTPRLPCRGLRHRHSHRRAARFGHFRDLRLPCLALPGASALAGVTASRRPQV
jgi:Na+/H+ antiporter NhaA